MATAMVLDAHAVIAYFEDEDGAGRIESLLREACRGDIALSMTTVNLGEVWYAIARSYSAALAHRRIEAIFSLPISLVTADWELARQAAQFKARGGISYADCFAAALALQHGATLVTGDREFLRLKDDIAIAWL